MRDLHRYRPRFELTELTEVRIIPSMAMKGPSKFEPIRALTIQGY